MAKPRVTECLIGVAFANAMNQFLYKAGIHKGPYLKMGFTYSYCLKPVKPRLKSTRVRYPTSHTAEPNKPLCPGLPSGIVGFESMSLPL